MPITEVSIFHHVGLVLGLLWFLSTFNSCYPIVYIVHERYIMRLRRKLEFEERRQSQQRRVLSDSETLRWLNHAIEKIWPICMEHIVSQKLLLPIVPWFLEKYKPWTAKKAIIQHLYMGRNPPLFTDIRVLHQTTDDDHLVLELGMNFLTADDMSGILAVKLRKRFGFGIWAKMHLTGMHIEGKVLVGIKFLQGWPFLGRLRVCFVEPPYVQLTVKPISSHGVNVTELPGIAGWLDNLLGIVFEQTLVEPNMLVVDVEKLVLSEPDSDRWFSVNEKEKVACVKLEIIEASDMKPSDMNGLADPYVKGQLGLYRFKTKIQWKTLSPKWHEEYKIPIFTWEIPNVLNFEVLDKDRFIDDILGNCSVSINDLRDGHRHDMWLSLQNIKVGRLHLAITVVEDNGKEPDTPYSESQDKELPIDCPEDDASHCISSLKSPKLADKIEPINVEGQTNPGIWVHQPGSDVSQTFESRKGKTRTIVTNNNLKDANDHPSNSGRNKFGSIFHRSSPRNEDKEYDDIARDAPPSPHANIKAEDQKGVDVKFISEDNFSNLRNTEGSGQDSPSQRGENVKGMAKRFLKKSARSLKHAVSGKGKGGRSCDRVWDSSSEEDDESLPSPVQPQESPNGFKVESLK